MVKDKCIKKILMCASTILLFSSNVFAADQTGTNPIDFANDFRVYNEYLWLNTDGDGNQNLTTAEMRTSFLGGKWQFRAKVRFNSLEADLNDDGSDDVDESGMGDTDIRFLTVPYSNDKNAVAFGLEVFLDTASNDALGTGATTLGPQLFYVKFLKTGLFAPGVQYKFSIDEDAGRDEIDQVLIDLNYLLMAKDKKSWFFTDPQIVIDNELDIEFAIVDFEFGWMMTKWTDLKGHSFYIRPSIGVGSDRPSKGSIEVGYKIIGW